MFKKILLAVVLALPMSCLAQKFATVDLEQVFQSMPEAKTMQTSLMETTKQFEDEFGKLQEEVNKLFTEFQTIQNDPNTPQSIKERRAQEVQEKADNVQKFRNRAEQELAEKRETLMAPIMSKLNDAVKAVGSEGGYTIVFPYSPELMLYTSPDVTDITAQVKAKLGNN